MSLFKAPKSVVSQLESLRQNFLWGGDSSKSKISLIKWEAVWKDLINLKHLDSMFEVLGPQNWSWKCGDGKLISFWNDSWMGNFTLRSKYPELYRLSRNHDRMINQFYFSPDGSLISWNLDFSKPLSPYESREADSLLLMLRNAALDISVEDSIIWNPSPVGEFLVSQAVYIMWSMNSNVAPPWDDLIWNNFVPSKIQIFHWLEIQGCIPVKFVLGQRGVVPFGQEINYAWCFDEVESVDHLLLQCPRSFDIWTSLFKWWSILWILPSSLANFTNDWNLGMGISGGKFWLLLGPCTIWEIWISRNKALFNGEFSCWTALVHYIKLKNKNFHEASNADDVFCGL
ncbi:LINE-1 reverse transcriptase isogeny [Tanacetum coccineum]